MSTSIERIALDQPALPISAPSFAALDREKAEAVLRVHLDRPVARDTARVVERAHALVADVAQPVRIVDELEDETRVAESRRRRIEAVGFDHRARRPSRWRGRHCADRRHPPRKSIASCSRRLHLAEQPLQPREMLLVVAAKVVDEAADGDPAVAFEDARGVRAARRRGRDAVQRASPRGAKGRERLGRIRVRVVAILGELVRIERGQVRIRFGQRALDALLIAVDLDVAHVADLADRGERFARDAVPRRRRPVARRAGTAA